MHRFGLSLVTKTTRNASLVTSNHGFNNVARKTVVRNATPMMNVRSMQTTAAAPKEGTKISNEIVNDFFRSYVLLPM